MSHPVVHFEIAGGEGGTLKQFYEAAFGWTVKTDNPMNYGIVERGDQGIGGGITDSMNGRTWVTVYVQSDDLAASLAKIEAAGGKTMMQPEAIEGGPEIALFTDPAGNMVGLVKGM